MFQRERIDGMLTLQDLTLLNQGLFSDKTLFAILLSIKLKCLGILMISLMTEL